MKKALVTLADAGYTDQAKQLFSSAYWHGGWDGDMVLIAHGMPEADLAWFESKGITVYRCGPLTRERKEDTYSITVFSKFFLFKEFFKRWDKVVYMDADIIVNDSLEGIEEVDGFGAKSDFDSDLYHQIKLCHNYDRGEIALTPDGLAVLQGRYDLSELSFNSGVMVIDTSIIKDDTFDNLVALLKEYRDISNFGDQLALNLFMYRKWKPIPGRFNTMPVSRGLIRLFFSGKAVMPVLHLLGSDKKPWQTVSPFHGMWLENLSKAEDMDLAKAPPRPQKRSREELERSERTIRKEEEPSKIIARRFFDLKELDVLYSKGKMKEFRGRLLKGLFTDYTRGYNRFIPYIFISLIPERGKNKVKAALRKAGFGLQG